MFTTIAILSCIVSILLILIVVIQNPKGGGIAAGFSAANQIAGVKRTNDFVEKATWTLAVILLLFSLTSRFFYGGVTEVEEPQSKVLEALDEQGGFQPPVEPGGVPPRGSQDS